MSDHKPVVPFWLDMAVLFSMTMPVMGIYALTGWPWLMPLGGLNLFLALAIIQFIRHVRKVSERSKGKYSREPERLRG